jgi:hypothetical protein
MSRWRGVSAIAGHHRQDAPIDTACLARDTLKAGNSKEINPILTMLLAIEQRDC